MEELSGRVKQRPGARRGPAAPQGQGSDGPSTSNGANTSSSTGTPNSTMVVSNSTQASKGTRESNGTKALNSAKASKGSAPRQAGNPQGASQRPEGAKPKNRPMRRGKAAAASNQAGDKQVKTQPSERSHASCHADTPVEAAHSSATEPAILEGQVDSSQAPLQTPEPIIEWAEETVNGLPAENATPVITSPKTPLVPEDIRRTPSALGGTTPTVSEQAGIDPCSGPGLAAALTAQTTSGLLKAFGDINLAAASITRLDDELRNAVVSDRPMNSEFLAQLHVHARTLGKLSRNLALLAETSVIGRLSEMAGPPQSHIYGLLGSLRDALGDVVRKVDADNTDPKQLLWRTAEECLRQATEPSGTVHIETALTAEESRNISAMYRADRGLPAEEDNSMSSKVPSGPKQLGESWVGFWTQVLDKCPGGPTLFNPANFGPSGSNMSYMFPFSTDVPRYLYRVVEDNLDLAASNMWLSSGDQPGQATPDLLSLNPEVAAKKLIHHLSRWHTLDDDNLVSWSSSLKHALQSAICRLEDSRVHKFDFNQNISVCVVDTTRFPMRQFARDRWLLRVYRDTRVARDMGRYYDALLDDQSVYNGEFFSQGMVDVKGRSSTCRLFELEVAGIRELYPELYNHPPGLLRHACDYRVTELRRQWSTRCKSTTEDIERAVSVAEKFGAPIDSMEVAIQLLAFKNRRIFKRSRPNDSVEKISAGDPVELRRYQEWTSMIRSGARQQGTRAALEKFFWLAPQSLKNRYRLTLESTVDA